MDHKAHIRIINPHAERICGNHQTPSVVNEILLIALPLRITQPRMVARYQKSLFCQPAADLLHRLSSQTIDDTALSRMAFYVILHCGIPVLRRLNGKPQIWPVKPCCNDIRLPQPQDIDHIIPYFFRGRGGKRAENRPLRQLVDKFHDF